MGLICNIFGHEFEIHKPGFTCSQCGSEVGGYHKVSKTCLRCGKEK